MIDQQPMIVSRPERLLTTAAVAERYSIHPKTVAIWERDGKLPKRVPGWPGTDPRWREADIDAHILAMCKAEQAQQVA